jgi:hypothetical protein
MGCGKTTIGKLLAEKLSWPFYDGDNFHLKKNVEKMRAGIALTDEDRVLVGDAACSYSGLATTAAERRTGLFSPEAGVPGRSRREPNHSPDCLFERLVRFAAQAD